MRLTVLVLLVLVALAAPASAATVAYTAPPPESPSIAPEESCARYFMCPTGRTAFTAAAGEANRLTVVSEAGLVVFRDTGAPLTAGPGCTARPDGAVACPGMAETAIDLGDGADEATAGVGVVRGGDGDDVVRGSRVEGGAGNDTLVGGDAADRLDGGPGMDVVTGGAGDDELLDTDAERDRLDAGPGVDLLSFDGRAGDVRVDLGARPQVGAENEVAGFERVLGGGGDDELVTDPAVNDVPLPVAVGGDGDDRLVDRSTVGLELLGGDGDDTLVAGIGSTELSGGDGDDTLEGGTGEDILLGDAGADTIRGRGGDDEARGGSGRDTVRGGPGDDRLYGDAGADRLDGGTGADRLFPQAGADRVTAGPGADRVSAADGTRDRIACGSGTDTAVLDRRDRASSCERRRSRSVRSRR
jgi:Ca2+-binding RTX toxin-like protein